MPVVLATSDGNDDAHYSGRWIGLRLPEDGTPEVVWSVREKVGVERAKPRGRPSPVDPAVFNPFYGGTIGTVVMQGIPTPRLNRFDPATGALDTGLILPRHPPGDFPAWADPYGESYLVPLPDGMLSASGAGGFGGFAYLTFYDYATGKIRWAFTKEYKSASPQSADPVGMSADGEHVYGMIWASRARLVELDARTGELERTWLFPDGIDTDLANAEVYVHGDLLIWLNKFDKGTSRTYAATFRLG